MVGADFDPRFLDWLFDKASDLQRVNEEAAAPAPAAHSPVSSYQANSRILSTALASTREDTNKRKADAETEVANKKRLPDQALPSGPRAMVDGRNLQDRMGPKRGSPMQVRGFAGGRPQMNQGGQFKLYPLTTGFQPHFRPQPPMQPSFNFFPQQDMMAQMLMMQSSMAQMGQMMAKMAEVGSTKTRLIIRRRNRPL